MTHAGTSTATINASFVRFPLRNIAHALIALVLLCATVAASVLDSRSAAPTTVAPSFARLP